MHRNRSLAILILIPLLLAFGACATKQAATPGEQALLDTGAKLKALSAEYVKTNGKYVAQCPPQSTTLDAATCNAWTRYTAEFVREYEAADGAWSLGDQVGADSRANALKAKLATYTSKTK